MIFVILCALPSDVDDCSRLEWSCENGGQAVDTGKSCECQCAAGYTGEHCETGKMSSVDTNHRIHNRVPKSNLNLSE